jgi:hypothetical protein
MEITSIIKLLEMVSRSYALALQVQDDNRDEQVIQALAEEVSGESAEFLALWDGNEGAFGDEESKDKTLVALVNSLKEISSCR